MVLHRAPWGIEHTAGQPLTTLAGRAHAVEPGATVIAVADPILFDPAGVLISEVARGRARIDGSFGGGPGDAGQLSVGGDQQILYIVETVESRWPQPRLTPMETGRSRR